MSCYGCEQNMANQLAHMDFGGCLYNDASMGFETPPHSPELAATETQFTHSAPEFVPLHEHAPIGCAVCITEAYFGEIVGAVRRASGDTGRCQEHHGKCAYCRDQACDGNAILCERCSYSGEGNAFIIEAFLEQQVLCRYDRTPSPSECWDCGCTRCIQQVAAFYSS